MTLEDLITLYRADAMDEAEPYFCSDKLLTLYANEAQNEACRRGRLLVDSRSSFCTLEYQALDTTIPLDRRIIHILRALDDDGQHLVMVDGDIMDGDYPAWQTAPVLQDRPLRLISGLDTNQVHLWPRPRQGGAVHLVVQRLPLKQLSAPSDEPEIRREAHPALVAWMLYRAYSRPDSDLTDNLRARTALAKFEAEFGPKVSARNEQWIRQAKGLMPEPLA